MLVLVDPVVPLRRERLHCTGCAQPFNALYAPGGPVQNVYQCPLCDVVLDVALPGTLVDWWADLDATKRPTPRQPAAASPTRERPPELRAVKYLE